MLRTLRTVRHSKPTQLAHGLLRRWPSAPVSWLDAPRHRLALRKPAPPAPAPARRVVDDGFRFLNETRRFEGDWSPRGLPSLWLDQLHSFRWLWELPPLRAAEVVRHWLDHQPPLSAPAWEAYPLSIRIREWIEWLLAHPDLVSELHDRMVASLAHQVRVLETRLEYHLLGNHILENAISLCWAGLSFQGPSAARWLAKGRRLLLRQLGEQVLGDGSHAERSPMYQSLLAEALLRLAEAAGPAPVAAAVRRAARAAGEVFVRTLRRLTHPDGEIALLNDAALGEAAGAEVLQRRFAVASVEEEPKDGPWSLPAAGYFGYRRGEQYLAFDAGPLGPDHQPGHGHADALSFELSHDGRRLFTDTGVLTYETGAARAGDRGTAAHNTVQVSNEDQAELWGSFRCGRRMRQVRGSLDAGDGGLRLRGSYVGTAAGARLLHARECRVEGPWLRFSDRLEAEGAHEAVLRLHVAPGLAIGSSVDGPRLLDSGLPLALVQGTGFEWALEGSVYHPEFGKELARPCLVARAGFQDRLSLDWAIRLL